MKMPVHSLLFVWFALVAPIATEAADLGSFEIRGQAVVSNGVVDLVFKRQPTFPTWIQYDVSVKGEKVRGSWAYVELTATNDIPKLGKDLVHFGNFADLRYPKAFPPIYDPGSRGFWVQGKGFAEAAPQRFIVVIWLRDKK